MTDGFIVDEDEFMTSDRQRIESVMYYEKKTIYGDEFYEEVVPVFHGRKFDIVASPFTIEQKF